MGMRVEASGDDVVATHRRTGTPATAAVLCAERLQCGALDEAVARDRHDHLAGLDQALAALWSNVPVQRCTVHKHRNLLAHAPERLHEEISSDYNDMIYADSKGEVEARRKSFLRKWRLKCRAVADSLEEAGAELYTFTLFPKEQWRSIRTTNAIERLHE